MHGTGDLLDLLIPTYPDHREPFSLLMRSLNTFMPEELVRSMTVVCVDPQGRFDEVLAMDTLKFRSRTQYFRSNELVRCDPEPRRPSSPALDRSPRAVCTGWLVQQMVKLAFARHTATDFYMVLDSTNVARRPVTNDDLLVDGRAACVLEDVAIQNPWWRGSQRVLTHRRFDRRPGRQALSCATPSLLHAPTVRKMLDWIEAYHRRPFEEVFLKRHPLRDTLTRTQRGSVFPTEFCLYYTYLDREALFDRLHFPSLRLQDGAAQLWHPLDRGNEAKLDRLLHGEAIGAFGTIQGPFWAELGVDFKQGLMERAGRGAAGSPPSP